MDINVIINGKGKLYKFRFAFELFDFLREHSNSNFLIIANNLYLEPIEEQEAGA